MNLAKIGHQGLEIFDSNHPKCYLNETVGCFKLKQLEEESEGESGSGSVRVGEWESG